MEADIIISGNVGQDVEWWEHERFDGRATFSVTVTPSVQRDGAWHDQPTTWYRVTCWRRLAVHVRDSLKKGDAVMVGGRLRLDRWVGENNVPRQEYAIDARWVGHDLRRGTALFERARVRQDPTEPIESDFEAARAEHEALRALEELSDELGEQDESFEAVDLVTGEVR